MLLLTALVCGVVLYSFRFFFTAGVRKAAVSESLATVGVDECQQKIVYNHLKANLCTTLAHHQSNLNCARMFEDELVGNLLLVLFKPSTTGESADTCKMIFKFLVTNYQEKPPYTKTPIFS